MILFGKKTNRQINRDGTRPNINRPSSGRRGENGKSPRHRETDVRFCGGSDRFITGAFSENTYTL